MGKGQAAEAEQQRDEVDSEESIILYPWDQTHERMAQKWRRAKRIEHARCVKALRLLSLQRRGRVYLLLPRYEFDGEGELCGLVPTLTEPVHCFPHWRENAGPDGADGVHIQAFLSELSGHALPFRLERQQFGEGNPGIIRLSEC